MVILKVEVCEGSSLECKYEDIVEVAKKTGCKVQFEHKGITLYCRHNDELRNIETNYTAALEQIVFADKPNE